MYAILLSRTAEVANWSGPPWLVGLTLSWLEWPKLQTYCTCISEMNMLLSSKTALDSVHKTSLPWPLPKVQLCYSRVFEGTDKAICFFGLRSCSGPLFRSPQICVLTGISVWPPFRSPLFYYFFFEIVLSLTLKTTWFVTAIDTAQVPGFSKNPYC